MKFCETVGQMSKIR